MTTAWSESGNVRKRAGVVRRRPETRKLCESWVTHFWYQTIWMMVSKIWWWVWLLMILDQSVSLRVRRRKRVWRTWWWKVKRGRRDFQKGNFFSAYFIFYQVFSAFLFQRQRVSTSKRLRHCFDCKSLPFSLATSTSLTRCRCDRAWSLILMRKLQLKKTVLRYEKLWKR